MSVEASELISQLIDPSRLKNLLSSTARGAPTSLYSAWGGIVSAIASSAKTALKNGPGTIVGAAAVGVALCVIAAGAIIMFVVAYLLTRARPRMPVPSRSAPLEDYMDQFAERAISSMEGIVKLKPMAVTLPSGQALVSLIEGLLKRGSSLPGEIKTYYKFYNSLRRRSSFISQYDLRENAVEFVSDGDIDADKVDAFVSGVFDPMQSLTDTVVIVSMIPNSSPDWAADATDSMHDLMTHVHYLRLLLSQRSDISRLYGTRRDRMPVAIWTVYYEPYVRDVFTHRIPELWSNSAENFKARVAANIRFWRDTVGGFVKTAPCRLAFVDPVERVRFCGEGFCGDATEQPRQPVADDEQDEIEGFLGFLRGLVSMVMTILSTIEIFFKAFGRFTKKFGSDPFGAIVSIIALFIGTLMGLVLIIAYIVMTVTMSFMVPVVLSAVLITFGWALIWTIQNVLYVVIIAVVFFILWIPDMLTNGMIVRLMRCENSPDAWASTPGFAEGNVFQRWGLACMTPCGGGTRYGGALWCRTKQGYMPSFCPQQQIFRAFEGQDLAEPYAFDRMRTPTGFSQKTQTERQRTVLDAFRDKMGWYQSCFRRLGNFDFINKHICSNLKRTAVVRGLPDEVVAKLRTLCKECYCRYGKYDGKAGGLAGLMQANKARVLDACERPKLCRKLAEEEQSAVVEESDEAAVNDVMMRALLLSTVTVVLVIVAFSMMRAATTMSEDASNLVRDTFSLMPL